VFVHPEAGPVSVAAVAWLALPPTIASHSSLACVVVAVGPRVHDDTNPEELNTAVLSSKAARVVGMPDASYTMALMAWTPDEPVVVMAMLV